MGCLSHRFRAVGGDIRRGAGRHGNGPGYGVCGWSVAGNWAPIPLVHLLYDWLKTVPHIRDALDRLASELVRARVERGGFWFYLLVTPLVGTWALAAAVKLLGIRPVRFLAPSFLSVLAFGVVIAAAIAGGLELFR